MPAQSSLSTRHAAAELLRWTAATLAGLLMAVAILVTWRRLAGALGNPLPPPVLLAMGVLLAGMAFVARTAWRAALPAETRGGRLLAIVPSAALVLVGLALSLPGSGAGWLAGFWAVIVAEECWAWRGLTEGRRKKGEGRGAKGEGREAKGETEFVEPSPVAQPEPQILQQLTRSQAADGSQQLAGWLRMAFAPGQRSANVHVAFCPPFERTPEVTVRQTTGPTARIKTAQLLPYGVRLDLKLAAVAESAEDVVLEFSAKSK